MTVPAGPDDAPVASGPIELDSALQEHRRCVVCGGVDDHPRHDAVIPPGQTSVFHHVDCGALTRPPCEHCVGEMRRVGADLTGEDLRRALRGEN